MDSLYAISLEFIGWLQETYPQLEGFFIFISSLGSLEFYLAALPLIYWTIDKRLGKLLGLVLFVSTGINTIFKQAFRGPRPFWMDPSLGILKTAGYGIPSGHTQNSTALFLLVASWCVHLRTIHFPESFSRELVQSGNVLTLNTILNQDKHVFQQIR